MEPGELLLIAAIILFLIDFLQLYKNKQSMDKRKLKTGFYATVLAVGLIVVSYSILVNTFIYDDFSLIEAYSYSSSSLSPFSKLRATWAGGGGSLLLLSLIIALVYFIFRFRTNDNPRLHGIAANKILLGLLIFFLFLTVIKNPFATLDGVAPEGRGLNPSLQSIWMTLHPPIVFIGYAFILLSVALAFAKVDLKQENDYYLLEFSTKIAWFFLTLGIASGGLWAYVVLGWGGYWSWDPVETASLMTWLALTAYFFIKPLTRKGKSLTKEFMILLTFEALIFLSALTRSSFRQSVHAYALSPAGPILLLSGLIMAVYFFYLKRKSDLPLWLVKVDRTCLHSVSLLIGFASLVAILVVCFIGVITPILTNTFFGMIVTTDIDFYNFWSFPFVMAFVLSLIGFNLPYFGLKKFSFLILGLIISSILLALFGFPTSNALANIGLPFLSAGLLSTVYSAIKISKIKPKKISSFSKKIVHFGILLTLIGVLVSAGARQSSVFVDAAPNSTLETFGISIKLGNFTVFGGSGRVYAEIVDAITPEYTSLRLDVDVLQDGKIYKETLWSYLYINYGFFSNPLVITTEKGDIYIHLNMTDSIYDALSQSFTGELSAPENLTLIVEKVPLVYIVWIGAALLCFGIALNVLSVFVTSILNRKK